MAKKNRSETVERLATALEKTKKKRVATNPKGGTPPEQYRFKPGQSGNPNGRAGRAIYAQALTGRMMRSCPPQYLCEDIGIDPTVTWGEAILIVLGRAALAGDVSAAREVLAALGVSGISSRTNVLVNVEQPEQRSATFEFLKQAHGLSEEQLLEVWKFMAGLPRQKPVIDQTYFPDDSYFSPGMPDIDSADSPVLHVHGLLEDPLKEDEEKEPSMEYDDLDLPY